MFSLRPHRQFNFVKLWKPGFILSSCLILLSIIGLVVSGVTTGSPLTMGTEFSGGTSIQINKTGDITEDQISEAFTKAASDLNLDEQISSIQTSTDTDGDAGFIVRTTNTDSNDANSVMENVEQQLGIDSTNAQVETIGPSWGASVLLSSLWAFILSCIGILIVIAIRYREPRMGVVALITLFHDMFIIIGVYAWAGMFFHMEITSDVIAALLAIIGYSLYDTIVVFHRINKNASPQMKCSMKTCANKSMNEIIVRSLNTSITSILPVFFMVILGTDTLLDFAFAMFCGMLIGVYSTIAISAPLYTLWKCRQPDYARLEKKYPLVVEQSPFTTEMMRAARKTKKAELKEGVAAEKRVKKEAKAAKKEAKAARSAAKAGKKPSAKGKTSVKAAEVKADEAPAELVEVEFVEEEQAPEPVSGDAPADGGSGQASEK